MSVAASSLYRFAIVVIIYTTRKTLTARSVKKGSRGPKVATHPYGTTGPAVIERQRGASGSDLVLDTQSSFQPRKFSMARRTESRNLLAAARS
eukprot:6192922-Pleurochrysis_carterae.AAC.1